MSRWLVLRALEAAGGAITDASGQASGNLGRTLGYSSSAAMSSLLKAMDRDGLIVRAINGKRTSRIALTPKGWEAAREVPSHVARFAKVVDKRGTSVAIPLDVIDGGGEGGEADTPPVVLSEAPALDAVAVADVDPIDAAPEPSDEAFALADAPLFYAVDDAPVFRHDADVTRLAETLLALVVRKAKAEEPGAELVRVRRDIDQARTRLASTLEENARLRRRVELLTDEVTALNTVARGLRLVVGKLESNLAAAIKAAGQGVALDEATLRDLDRLIREVPRFPVSKAG